MITELKDNEVFVFGTNANGFHGAGAAGYAMLHVSGNLWRTTYVPGTTMYLDKVPNGTKGYWAVKGIAHGIMHGLYGKSYGIMTVIRPGTKRSVSLEYIEKKLRELAIAAKSHSDLKFIVAPIATGYAGYTTNEILSLRNKIQWPSTITFL